MILLHRLTPFVISLLSAAGFGLLMWDPLDLKFLAAACFLLIPILFARLLLWELRRPAFWVFLGTPSLLLLSSLMFFLIIESTLGAWVMLLSVTLALALYAENLFAFYHLPSSYQAYSLEFLSLMCYMVSAFFFTGSAYMAQLFLELPLWIPAIATFLIVLLATVAVFWVSKIGFETGILFAVTGAIIMTQVYIAQHVADKLCDACRCLHGLLVHLLRYLARPCVRKTYAFCSTTLRDHWVYATRVDLWYSNLDLI